MSTHRCAYCKKLKQEDQLMPAQSKRLVCIPCSERYHMCEICGSTTKENYGPHGQIHYEEDCFK